MNKYNMSKQHILQAIGKFANELPDELFDDILISILEQSVPDIMRDIHQYKSVPLAIDLFKIHTQYEHMRLSPEDIAKVIGFNKDEFDLNTTPYPQLVMMAEVGKIHPKIVTRVDNSRTFSIYEHTEVYVFGSENYFNLDGTMSYKLYCKCPIKVRDTPHHGKEKYIKFQSSELRLRGLHPDFEIDQEQKNVRVVFPVDWVDHDTIERTYKIRVPSGGIYGMSAEAFANANPSMDANEGMIELSLPEEVAQSIKREVRNQYNSTRPYYRYPGTRDGDY